MQNVNMQIGEEPALDWIELKRIRVDSSYQRPVKPKRVEQILREFTWAQFGALMLVAQDDGTFTVYDGQHRYEAAKQHPQITRVPAAIVKLNQAFEEAQSFLGVNINRSAISTVEKYWAGIEAGNESMMRVCSVLEEAGCEVVPPGTKSPAANRTSAISAIERAIKSYGDKAVTDACKAILAAWPKDTKALNGVVIQATARLLRNNRKIIDFDRLVLKLKGKNRAILSSDAEAIRRISGSDAGVACAKALVEIYNKGLQTQLITIGEKR